MTGMEADSHPWAGETRRISKAVLMEHPGDLNGPIDYLAGPPGNGGRDAAVAEFRWDQ
jgi:hypothetical protein